MTTKDDFTGEEWNVLLLAPTHAASYVITADMSAMGMIREMKALGKALVHPDVAEAARELVSAVSADIQAKTKNKEALESPEADEEQQGEDAREPSREGLREAAALLDEKCAADEAAGFKQWLVDLAQVVAEADKEGSHFGIGGVQVTDKEKAALAEIKSYLGI